MTKKNTLRHLQPRKMNAPSGRGQTGVLQEYGTVAPFIPIDLDESARRQITEQMNLLLADTMTLRDLYKKAHWHATGPTFYQLHLLFDKHYSEQAELVDAIAERIQVLGGLSLAMSHDVAETTRIERPPRGREEPPAQIARLLDAHRIVITETRKLARLAAKLEDDGTNDLLVSDVLRTNEMQVWFLNEHLVPVSLASGERESVAV